MGDKREREKDKETIGKRERWEKRKMEKCSLLPQWRKRKVTRKTEEGLSQQIVHLGCVVEKGGKWGYFKNHFCGTPLR